MVSTPSAPAAPDPVATASAQTGTNVDTAIANAALGHTNQVDQYGNKLTYAQTGSTQMKAQDGTVYDLPTYTATQTLSDANQKLLGTNQQTQQSLANTGLAQSQKIGDLLSTNADFSASNIDNYTDTHYRAGFDRQWNNQQSALEQRLADQGVTPGSQAYQNAMRDFTTQRQSAEDQYLGDMYSNAQTAIVAQRNQPINEITALMSGSQVSSPSFTNTPSTQLPTVDYAGITNQSYANQMSAYNSQLASANATNGGLFGLGSSLLGGWAMGGFKTSDRRLKTEIERIGTLANGLGAYAFRYLWGGPREVGVMADEVAAIAPYAVAVGPGGFLMVDYDEVL